MNKVFYATLAALSLAFAACNDQAEGNQNPVDPDGKVSFTLNVGIPKAITTYASNNGGATNVDADDYDLRYIVEVWSKDASPVLIARRSQTVAKDFKTTEAVFNLHLPPANYDFVFWADFVDEGATKDKFYKTSASTGSDEEDVEASAAAVGTGLTAIEILPTGTDYPNVCNDARDAFYATKTFDLTSASVTEKITLKRPFGKFRLVSKSLLDTFDFDIDDYTAKLEYVRSTTSLPAGFNAKTGAVDVSKTLPPAAAGYTNAIVKEDVVAGGTTYKNAAVVLYDYVFAPSGQVVDFDATVYQNTSTQVSKLQLASIPISENKLTTILVDNIFGGSAANFTIIVDDPFDDETVDSWEKVPMTLVEGGTFSMGTDESSVAADQKPAHSVTLDSYWIGIYEITQKQWLDVMSSFPNSNTPNSTFMLGDNYPVYYIDWYSCIEFCNALSALEGRALYYNIDKVNQDPDNSNGSDNKKWTITTNPTANGYRLPTEAEWEYAAKGGKHNSAFTYSGSDNIDEVGWYLTNSGGNTTAQVGTYKPNALYIYDMSGNVAEWCWDWKDDYDATPETNPTGPASGSERVIRLGNFHSPAAQCTVVYRSAQRADAFPVEAGFRIACNAD
jgi:formylglycine-generating enzyme required for sulfatase activity